MTALVAVNFTRNVVVTDNGAELPITTLFDRFGDETSDPAEAVAFVCGSGEVWLQGSVAEFSRPTWH